MQYLQALNEPRALPHTHTLAHCFFQSRCCVLIIFNVAFSSTAKIIN